MTTRQDEIEKAAEKEYPLYYADYEVKFAYEGYIKGAKWADENPCNSLFDDYAESYSKLERKLETLRQQLAIAQRWIYECAKDTESHYGCQGCKEALAQISEVEK